MTFAPDAIAKYGSFFARSKIRERKFVQGRRPLPERARKGPAYSNFGYGEKSAPFGLVARVRDGDRWVFIDWDGAGPGSRLWDLAYTASTFVPFCAAATVVDGPRLRALADGYGP